MALTKVTGSVIKDSVSLSGNVSVGGTLTYQDVTNVDALGIGTFRTGINVSGGQVNVGSNIKLGTAGVITATSFVGSGANLTSLPAQATIANNADNRVITGGSGVNLNAESNVLYDGTNFGIGKSPSRTLDVQGKIRSSDSVCFGDNSSTPSEGVAIHRPAASTLALVTNNTERLRITSTGEIKQYGFTGTSDTAADDLVLGNTTDGVNRGITIWSHSSQNGSIAFADNDSNFRGAVQYIHNGDILRFLTAGDERLRINSSGHLSVGGSNVTDVNLLTLNGSGAAQNVGMVFNKTNSPAKAYGINVHNGTGDLLVYDYTLSTDRIRISSAGHVTKPATPAFFATHSGAGNNNTGYLVYNTSGSGYYNNGGHFDVGTGKFTAPVTGIYHFHFHGFFQSNQSTGSFEINLYRTDSGGGGTASVTRQYGNRNVSTPYGPSISIHYTGRLTAGQYMRVHTSMPFHGSNGYFFGGYLIG